MTDFYIHDGLIEKGPLTIDKLKLEALKKDTPIWYEGLEHWTTAGEIDLLKSLFVNKTVPPPLWRTSTDETKTTKPASSLSPDDIFIKKTKKSFKTPLFILGAIVVVSLVVGLVYENKNQAETLNEVQNKVAEQEQQVAEQEQQIATKQIEKAKLNAVLTEKYMGYRNNWRNFIVVGNNAFSYSEMGGISNLLVVIYNRTDKSIDEVQVKVDYIKASGGLFKTENISVTNIGPNSNKSVSAPSSDRGTSVKMQIENISASSFHFCYPSGMEGNKNLDPYFCK